MKTLCIIPGRSGSKGVINKNIKKLKNRYLFEYSVKFANKLKFVNETVFSTDSEKYLKLASKYKKLKLSKRPKKISTDNTLMIEVVKHEVKKYEKKQIFFDFILLLQPTCPFRAVKDFNLAYNVLRNKNFDSVVTVTQVKDHPDRMKIFKNNKLMNYNIKLNKENFLPRQKLSKVFIRSGSMYFFKSSLLKDNLIVGKRVYGIEVKNKYSVNIDTQEDFFIARQYV